jgi:hypothetical protein
MTDFRRLVACLLVLTQALVAAGLGPRALCRDPNGSTCVDSVLSPCCCHRQQEVPCCGEDGCGESLSAEIGSPQIASVCQCVCTPVAAQPLVVQQTDVKASLDHVTGFDAVVAVATLPVMPWPMVALSRCGPLRTEPPGCSALSHLDSVILRL